MIQVRVFRDGADRCRRIEVSGHAGAAPHGEDIVCAGVSAVVQVTMLGLQEWMGAAPAYGHRRGKAHFGVSAEQLEREGVRALMESAALGLRAIAARYDDFVRIEEKRTESRSGGGDADSPAIPGERGRHTSPAKGSRKTRNVQEASHE